MHCWLTSSKELGYEKSRRSMTAVPHKLRALKEQTKKEGVLQTLEAGAHPQPWAICSRGAFQCCDPQARGMQQVRKSSDWLPCDPCCLTLWDQLPVSASVWSKPSRRQRGHIWKPKQRKFPKQRVAFKGSLKSLPCFHHPL